MEVSYRYRSSKPSRRNPIRFAKMRFNIKKVLTAFAIIAGVGIFFAVGAFAWISRDLPNPNKLLSRAVPLSTKIYDRTGTNLLYDIHKNEQRSLITIKDVPNHLKWATITAEDRNFYTHSGFDLKGIARAIYKNVIRREKVQGGSTITQQFVKNALLTTKKTFTRKTKELILSYQIERNFSKDEPRAFILIRMCAS
jgi:penicillin-binding protein 1A